MAVGGNTFINAMLPYCCLENFFADTERYPEIELKDLKIAKAGEKIASYCYFHLNLIRLKRNMFQKLNLNCHY